MGIFRLPRFIRRYLRRRTSPIPVERARSRKRTLSFIYFILAWNVMGLSFYEIIKNKRNQDPSEKNYSGRWWQGKIYTSSENIKYYRVQGLSIKEVKDSDSELDLKK